jgi:hypothetical protein
MKGYCYPLMELLALGDWQGTGASSFRADIDDELPF